MKVSAATSLLALAAGITACASPTGVHLKQLRANSVSTLAPAGSVVFFDHGVELRSTITGRQGASLSREYVTGMSCDAVSAYYSTAMTSFGWVSRTYLNNDLDDLSNVAWMKGTLSFGLATVKTPALGAPPTVHNAPVNCTFRIDLQAA